jgi:hypothetical protein
MSVVLRDLSLGASEDSVIHQSFQNRVLKKLLF